MINQYLFEVIKFLNEIEEDESLLMIAERRDSNEVKFVSHEEAWGSS